MINEYTYRIDGLRDSKTANEVITKHLWDGSNIAAELDGNGTVADRYIRGIGLIASKDSSGVYTYYNHNAHGDVVQLVNASGAVVKSYDYDAFGVEVSPDPNDRNVFRYSGEYWDKETGTYYLRARSYQPSTGRFMSPDTHWNPKNMIYGDNPAKWNERGESKEDPLGLNAYTYVPNVSAIRQSGNLYVYAGNNPIMYRDPSGEILETILDIGGLIWSAYDMWNDPSWANAGFLLWDIGAIVLPVVPGSYVGKGVKAGVQAAGKVDDVIDAAKILNKVDDVADVAKGVDKLVDGAKMSSSQALDAAENFLGKGYKDMGGGRFVSSDGARQVRMTNSDLSPVNNHAGSAHMNFETLAPNPNKPGKMQIINNKHIFLGD